MQRLKKHLYKGFVAAGMEIKTHGTVLFTVSDKDKEEAIGLAKRFSTVGYRIMATEGTAKSFEEAGVHTDVIEKIGAKGKTLLRCDSKW